MDSITETVKKVQNGEISAAELTKKYLDTIDEKDKDINAFISVIKEQATARAEYIDSLKDKKNLKLCGIPFAVKDNIVTEGIRTTCASEMLKNFVPPYTATAVRRLTENGAVLIGKTNMDEFGMGSGCDKSIYGPTRNPVDTMYSPGGSSGGSAASVRAAEAMFSLGSDTGGSSRQPAAMCGLTAMKPTYGMVSRYGLIQFASSLETICPITTNVKDNALILSVIAGQDDNDMTSLDSDSDGIIPTDEISIMPSLKIGYADSVDKLCTESIKRAFAQTVRTSESLGAEVNEISLPNPQLALDIYYVTSSAEASSDLARYDGIRYSVHTDNADAVQSRSAGFGDEVKKRILMGTYALASSAINNNYAKVREARVKLCSMMNDLFDRYDIIMMSTTAETAFKVGAYAESDDEMYAGDIFTVYANLTGCPAITIPCGRNGKFPIGVTLMGRKNSEKLLYQAAYELEKTLDAEADYAV